MFDCLVLQEIGGRKKNQAIVESRDKLDKMLVEFEESDDLNVKQGIEILMHYYLRHLRLLRIKKYPQDLGGIIRFGASFIAPIAIGLSEIL